MTNALQQQLAEYGHHLEDVLGGMVVPTESELAAGLRRASRPSRRGWLVAAAAFGVTMLLVGGVVGWLRSTSGEDPSGTPGTTSAGVTTTGVPTTSPEPSPATTIADGPPSTTVAPPAPDALPIPASSIATEILIDGNPAFITAGDSGVWIGDFETDRVWRLDADTGEADEPVRVGAGRIAHRGAVAGSLVWLGDPARGEVAAVAAATGEIVVPWFSVVDEGEAEAAAVAVDGDLVWVTSHRHTGDGAGPRLLGLDAATGEIRHDVDLAAGLMASDGAAHTFYPTLAAGGGFVWTVLWEPDETTTGNLYLVVVDPATGGVAGQNFLGNGGTHGWSGAWGDAAVIGDTYWLLGNAVCLGPDLEPQVYGCHLTIPVADAAPFHSEIGNGFFVGIDATTLEVTANAFGVGVNPFSVTAGDRYLWYIDAVDENTRVVRRVDPDLSRVVGGPITFDVNPTDLVVHDGVLWVTSGSGGRIFRIDIADLPVP